MPSTSKTALKDADYSLLRRVHQFISTLIVGIDDDVMGYFSPDNVESQVALRSLPSLGKLHGANERSLIEEAAKFFSAVGIEVENVLASGSPEFVLDEVDRIQQGGFGQEIREKIRSVPPNERINVLPLFSAMRSELRSLSMFGLSLSELVGKAGKSDESLYRAVQVDSTVLRSPEIAQRVGAAEATKDSVFLDELSKSVSKAKSRRHKSLDGLRIMIAVVDRLYGIDALPDDDLVRVFQTELRLIGQDGEDSLEAIKWHINRWKKSKEGIFEK